MGRRKEVSSAPPLLGGVAALTLLIAGALVALQWDSDGRDVWVRLLVGMTISAAALTYLAGLLLCERRSAQILRVTGFTVIVIVLLFPSQLTLLLPLAAAMAPALFATCHRARRAYQGRTQAG